MKNHPLSLCRSLNLLALVLSFSVAVASTAAQQGSWGNAFNHTDPNNAGFPNAHIASSGRAFEAVHMAVIPTGTNEGKVLVWDVSAAPFPKLPTTSPTTGWTQRWSIITPEAAQGFRFQNFELLLPHNPPKNHGDLFCSGHAWMYDGTLLVAGGHNYFNYISTPPPTPPGPDVTVGHQLAYKYDPVANLWTKLLDLDRARWYPTVTNQGESLNRLLVFGGVNYTPHSPTDTAINTYEAYNPTLGWELTVQPGPRSATNHPLGVYPRMNFVSDQATGINGPKAFMSGQYTKSAHVNHAAFPGVWVLPEPQQNEPPGVTHKDYACSVLFPNLTPAYRDIVVVFGGEYNLNVLRSVNMIDLKLSPPSWWGASQNVPQMKKLRNTANAVLLPDGSVLIVGGRRSIWGAPEVPEFNPELFRNGAWTLQTAAETSPRTYHSCSVLLPSGRVLSGSGDTRTWDYQVFTPHYLQNLTTMPRPVWGTTPAPPTIINYDQGFEISYTNLPFGVTVDKVVLMAPASVTHHSDMHQRYEQLVIDAVSIPPGSLVVIAPKNATHAPRGFYMMFMISSQGTPSVAHWVRLQ